MTDEKPAADRPALPAPVPSDAAADWLRDNAAALDSSNRWMAERGLPLARWRPV